MSDEPAFPHPGGAGDFTVQNSHLGMTLRDYFAAQALPSVINKCVPEERQEGESMEQMFVRKAYRVANEMLAARSISSPDRVAQLNTDRASEPDEGRRDAGSNPAAVATPSDSSPVQNKGD